MKKFTNHLHQTDNTNISACHNRVNEARMLNIFSSFKKKMHSSIPNLLYLLNSCVLRYFTRNLGYHNIDLTHRMVTFSRTGTKSEVTLNKKNLNRTK